MIDRFKNFEASVIKDVDGVAKSVEQTTVRFRKSVLERFPFLIIGLSTFGVVAVLYSFEQMIEMVPLLDENPFLIFLLGITALGITGTLYKKLQ